MRRLGSIIVPPNGAASNTDTAVPFSIPAKYTYVLIETPIEAAGFNITVDSDADLTSNSTEFDAAGNTSTQIACPPPNAQPTVVAIFNAGAGGTCAVWGTYGIAQS